MSERIHGSLQENLLVLLCFDDERAKFIRNAVPAELFEGIYNDVAARVYEFIDKQGEPPREHVADLFSDVLEGKDKLKRKNYKTFLLHLYEARGRVNGEYVLSRITEHLKRQRLKEGLSSAVELVLREDDASLAEAETVLRKALDARLALFDPGVSLSNPAHVLKIFDAVDDSFPTGMPCIDARGLGPKRKCLHLFIGLSGRGKSWWFINLGRQAVLNRFRVLHVTLEMSDRQVMERYMQNLFGAAKRGGNYPVTLFRTGEDGSITGVRAPAMITPRIVLRDPGAKEQIAERIEKWQQRLKYVQIKEFPTGSLTVRQLEAYMDSLEVRDNFIPDLLLVDYPDIMNVGGSSTATDLRHRLSEIYVNLRGLAVSRNIAVAVVSQSNREGLKAKVVTEGNVGEDWGKIANSDDVWAYNQSEAEQKLGLARLFIAKARGDHQRFFVAISQNYHMGQFVRSSGIVATPYWEAVGDGVVE
jgi:hypothetical protein